MSFARSPISFSVCNVIVAACEGIAPKPIIASKVVNGATIRTRPLCPSPQKARYKGFGSTDDAANFTCSAN
ncbi:MAG: tannase/feruloyl esterase family alpha/beta hydrolase [Blastocatellia bacterium]|nr:tannase/feruloyl esterase family alpha/beta hydrolase [Blastocatellia bacterium]